MTGACGRMRGGGWETPGRYVGIESVQVPVPVIASYSRAYYAIHRTSLTAWLAQIFRKHRSALMIAMVQLREPPSRSDRQIVMARLARKIGRGHNAIYHGTRHLPLVRRAGKLLPAGVWDPAVFFTRSPEVAAYWANMLGREMDQFCGGILVLNRASLVQNYRLEPSRYAEDWKYDEREENVLGRSINIRRHLLGVVR